MKIAFLVRGLSNGGAERVAAQLTLLWTHLGHEVALLTQLPPSDAEFEYAACARRQIDPNSLSMQNIDSLRRELNFDVMVFNDAMGADWFAGCVANFEELKVPVILINHHTPNNWLYTTCNATEVGMDAILSGLSAMVCVDPIWALWWHYRGVPSLYISNPVAMACRGEKGEDGEKGERGEDGEKGEMGEKVLVWIGRVTDWAKQPELAIDVFARVLQQIPDAKLIMLGTKTPAAERALRRRLQLQHSNTHTLPDSNTQTLKHSSTSLALPGFVPNTADYLHQATLHLFTSLTEVTVPQVVMESQAAGVPTVALDQPVLEGAGGVVTKKNVEDLAAEVIRLLQDPEAFAAVRANLVAYGNKMDARRAQTEVDWSKLLSTVTDADGLLAFRQKNIQGVNTAENIARLMRELHRSERYFVTHSLPQLKCFQKLRKRMNVRYLWSRVLVHLKHNLWR